MTALSAARVPADDEAGDAVASSAGRIEALLGSGAVRLSTVPDALGEALAAAARAVGVTLPPHAKPAPGEVPREAIARIAATCGLVARPVPLADAAAGEAVAPLLALPREGAGVGEGTPALIQRRGGRTTLADAQSRFRPRPCNPQALAAYESEAFVLTPALPDARLRVRDLLRFGLPQARGDLLGFAGATLAAGAVAALLPLVTGPLIEVVVPEREHGLLAQIGLFLVVVFVASLGTRYAAAIAKLRIDGRVGLMLRIAAIDRATRVADADAFAGRPRPPAPIAALSTRSLESFHRGVWGLVLALASAILVATPSLVVLAKATPAGAGLVALVFAAGLALGAWLARRRARALMHGLVAPQSWMATAYEALAQVDTVRAGAAEGRVFARWTDGFLSLRHRFLRADRVGVGSTALESAFEGAIVLAAIVALAIAGALADGATTAAFVVAAGAVAGAGSAVIGSFGEATMLGLQRRMIAPLLEAVPPPRRAGAVLPEPSGRIEVRGLAARPAPAAPLVLEDVSFEIAPGEHVGIVGPSGSGKSTLVKAMLGLIPIEAGAVLYDGVDLASLDAQALRRTIGIVGQSGRLFPGTLLDNVAAGLDVSPRDAAGALEQAGLGETLAALPLGLATPIGDAGAAFSGGQVQRILLARAFVGRPRLLVLDEATSALDPAVQAHVAAAVDAMGASVIAIAHRLDTLRRFRRILVMDEGRIVESGDWAGLARAGGLFARLIAAEAGVPRNRVHADQQRLRAMLEG
ncbi:ATP-binding cassette domain-containing protein [Salinarimonas chemoclinalis]|uniref:ATP-binding cassette domain-containing protein n=1 Tax=Salinarimonas chemoclinalis TaxID=3241599 RepID=UPI003557416A